jgi:hypothetical protein
MSNSVSAFPYFIWYGGNSPQGALSQEQQNILKIFKFSTRSPQKPVEFLQIIDSALNNPNLKIQGPFKRSYPICQASIQNLMTLIFNIHEKYCMQEISPCLRMLSKIPLIGLIFQFYIHRIKDEQAEAFKLWGSIINRLSELEAKFLPAHPYRFKWIY